MSISVKDVISIFSAGGPSKAQLTAVGLGVSKAEDSVNASLASKLNTFGQNWGSFIPSNLLNAVANGASISQSKSNANVNDLVISKAKAAVSPYLPLIVVAVAIAALYFWRKR